MKVKWQFYFTDSLTQKSYFEEIILQLIAVECKMILYKNTYKNHIIALCIMARRRNYDCPSLVVY